MLALPARGVRADAIVVSRPAQATTIAEIYVVLEYPFEDPPRPLSVRPPGVGEGGRTTASAGFLTYHLGLPVTDFRYLGTEEVLDLDWEDPFSRYRNLERQYDAPVSAFLYVDAHEVRKEVVLRPKDLEPWLDLCLEGLYVIPVGRQGEIEQKVAAFLKERGKVTIDGASVPPVLDRIDFLRRTLRTTGVVDPPPTCLFA